MKRTIRLTALTTALAMTLSLTVFATAEVFSTPPVHDCADWTQMTADGGRITGEVSYRLDGSIALENDIVVASGATLNLCLNDNALSGTGNSSVIWVKSGGTLNLYDGEEALGTLTDGVGELAGDNRLGGGIRNEGTTNLYGGTITGNTATSGGGVYNGEGATFTMSGGAISHNQATEGGGLFNAVSSDFTLSDGKIFGNAADTNGGGVANTAPASFQMTGGEISGNTAGTNGGGVYNKGTANQVGTFALSDGTIMGNFAPNGGGVYTRGTLTASGLAKITDNFTAEVQGAPSNLYLATVPKSDPAETLTFDGSGLTTGAQLGLSIDPTVALPSPLMGAVPSDWADMMTSDDATLSLFEDNGTLGLRAIQNVLFGLTTNSATLGNETITAVVSNNADLTTEDYTIAYHQNGEATELTEPGVYDVVVTITDQSKDYRYNSNVGQFTLYAADADQSGDHDITYVVQDATLMAVANAQISLTLNGQVISTTFTDAEGRFTFNNVNAGLYNLVITADGVTTTIAVHHGDENQVGTITLPSGNTSSLVEFTDPTLPTVVVGGLDAVADAHTEDGSAVEIKLTLGNTSEQADKDLIPNEESHTLLFLDIDLLKTVTDALGTATQTPLTTVDSPITFTITLPADQQGQDNYAVYRLHDGKVDTLTQDDTQEEHFTVSEDGKTLTIQASRFSLYAVASYANASTGGGGGGTSTAMFSVSAKQPENGTITLSGTRFRLNSKVTFTVKADEGYVIEEVLALKHGNQKISLTDNKNGTYSYIQPGTTVTISAVIVPESVEEDKDEETLDLPFTDVKEADWFYDSVVFAYENGLMQGTDKTTFAPNLTTTRGMIATILFRMSGEDAVKGDMPFADVADDLYYTEAILWAHQNDIVKGYDAETFGPDDYITREQMATMLHRYAKYADMDVTVDEDSDFDCYDDADTIGAYAVAAMEWACATGLIQGTSDSTLSPLDTATRAEVATLLMRFDGLK